MQLSCNKTLHSYLTLQLSYKIFHSDLTVFKNTGLKGLPNHLTLFWTGGGANFPPAPAVFLNTAQKLLSVGS